MTTSPTTQRQLRIAARAFARHGLAHAYGHCSGRIDERHFLVCAARPSCSSRTPGSGHKRPLANVSFLDVSGSGSAETALSDSGNQRLGTVRDVMIDTRQGRVRSVVGDFGTAVPSMSNKLTAVPFSKFSENQTERSTPGRISGLTMNAVGVFRAAAFDGVPRDAVVDRADVQKTLLARGQLAGFEIKERFYEIGSPEGLRELDQLLR